MRFRGGGSRTAPTSAVCGGIISRFPAGVLRRPGFRADAARQFAMKGIIRNRERVRKRGKALSRRRRDIYAARTATGLLLRVFAHDR